MIDFWIFPLSTIWGAYHSEGFRFVLWNLITFLSCYSYCFLLSFDFSTEFDWHLVPFIENYNLFLFFSFTIGMNSSILISCFINTKFIVISRQNNI